MITPGRPTPRVHSNYIEVFLPASRPSASFAGFLAAAWMPVHAGHSSDLRAPSQSLTDLAPALLIPVLLGALIVVAVWVWQYFRVTRQSGQKQRILYAGPMVTSVLVMLVGLALTVQLTRQQSARDFEDLHQRFMVQVQDIAAEVEEKLQNLVTPLNGIRGTFLASQYISRDEFERYSVSRDAVQEFAGVRGFGYIERVPRRELAAFEAQQRLEGAAGFKVWPSSGQAQAYVVKYVEPVQENRTALGFDIASEPARLEAAERAMRSGRAAMTAPITLVQDPQKLPAVLVLLPVYAEPNIPVTEALRVRTLKGWAYAPVVLSDLLSMGRSQSNGGVAFQLRSAAPGAAQSILFDSQPAGQAGAQVVDPSQALGGLFVSERPISVLGVPWILQVRSSRTFDAALDQQGHLQTAALGSTLSVLAAMVVWLLMAGRIRANDIARSITADLDRMAKVAQRTSNAVIFSDTQWRITWVNEGFSRMTGYSSEDAVGQQPEPLLSSPKADPVVMAGLADAMAKLEAKRCTLLQRRKDGSDYWAEIEVMPLWSDDGKLSGYLSIQVDITAETQARQELMHERERFQNVLDGTDVGTWERNRVTGEQHANERWFTMMGFRPEEARGDVVGMWQRQLQADDLTRLNNAMTLCLQGQTDRFSLDVRVRRKDGSWMWITTRAKVMSRTPDGQVEWIGGVNTDITESKQTELHLRDAEAFLDRAGRIAGVGAWQMDLATGAMEFSEQTCLLYGKSSDDRPTREEFLAKYPPPARAQLEAAIAQAIGGGHDWDLLLDFIGPKGDARWVRIFGEVEFDDGGAARLVGALQDVTRDQLARQEADRSSALLRGAIDAINEAFVVYDPQDRLVFCNDKYRALYTRSADLIVPGASFESIVRGGAERGQYVEALGRIEDWVAERIATHRSNKSMEQRLDDGRWLKVVERTMPDGHIVGFRVDITEIKHATEVAEQASARLAEEQRRLQSILEGTNVGTWEWNIQTGESFYNEQWHSMLGYTLDELQPVGYDTWSRLAHPEDLVPAMQKLQAHIRGESLFFEAEIRMQHKSGAWRWVLTRGKLTRWLDDGRPLWVSGTQMDITERKHAEQALADTMVTLQSVLDSAVNVGVISTDVERKIRVFNRGAENLLGYRAQEVLNTSVALKFVDAVELTAYQESLALVLGHEPGPGETFEHLARNRDPQEWTFVRQDGSRFRGSAIFSPMLDMQGRRIGQLAILQDISRQKEYEASLREAMRLAEQSSVAKSQFLANMSHEIRTPMNAILGMLQLLRNTPLSPRQRDYADKTEGAARSLLGLLNDILDFSKVEAGKMQLDPQPFLVDGLLSDLSVILSANLGERNVDLLFDVDPAIPSELVADSLRLKQILINLGGNAVKFTEKGQVVIAWKLVGQTPERARVEIAVRDTGIGIAPENQARIFEAFTQAEANTTRRFGGTGLGLVISTRLVRLMGGELALHSEVGRGTTFSFTLDFALPALGIKTQEAPAPASQAPRALLVDDNPAALDSGVAAMRTLGWEVVAVGSGEQALSVLRQELDSGTRPFDVAFVDWQMPDMDGWETLRGIRRLFGEGVRPKLIMLSRQTREALARRTGREQELLDGLMVKPLTAAMFRQAYTDACNRNVNLSGADSTVPEGPGRLAGMRILLVEDNPINQQVARELLMAEGAQVTLADNGQVGVDAVRGASPQFDVVLMDLQMPVMDGLSAARLIRQDPAFAALPIVAMTANAMASDREACLQAGMNDHVGKPFDLEHLVQTLVRHTGWVVSGQGLSNAAPARGVPPEEADAVSPGMSPQSAPSAESWPPGIEVAAALGRMGGKRSLLQRTMQSFLSDQAGLSQRLLPLLSGGDYAAAKRELHALKGLCGTLGLAALSAQAREAESACQAPVDAALLEQRVNALLADLTAARPELERVIAQLGMPQGVSTAGAHASANPSVDASIDSSAGSSSGPSLKARPDASLSNDSVPSVAADAILSVGQTADTASNAPDAQWLEGLRALHLALQASDMEAMELHAQLRQTADDAWAHALEPLDAAMAELEFEQAAVACEKLVTLWAK